jgi:DNA-binding MarR family transcriptional regulator
MPCTVSSGTMAIPAAHLVEDQHSAEEEFLTAFEAFAQAVRRARGAPAQASEAALTLSQYALLSGLADREVARVSDLAAEAGVTPSTATRILDALERRGIVSRTRPPEDRRAVAINLTETGRKVLCGHHHWVQERQRSFYAALPGVEQELAPDLLLRLAAWIDDLAVGPQD